MTRVFDLDGHPSMDGEHQLFTLVLDGIDDLSPADVLRLTDRATGDVSYWRADAARDSGVLEHTSRGWRGRLSQTELAAKTPI